MHCSHTVRAESNDFLPSPLTHRADERYSAIPSGEGVNEGTCHLPAYPRCYFCQFTHRGLFLLFLSRNSVILANNSHAYAAFGFSLHSQKMCLSNIVGTEPNA